MFKRTPLVAFIVVFLLVGHVSAQDVNKDDNVQFLVPLSVPFPVSGALGTSWKSELWVHNGTNDTLTLNWHRCLNFPPPECPEPLHRAAVTEQAFPDETRSDSGALVLHIPTSVVAGVTLSSRLYELSRRAQPAGINIPIIREDQFFTRPVRLIAIPVVPTVRASIRLYDPRRLPVGPLITGLANPVRLELFAPNGVLVAQRTLLLSYNFSPRQPGIAAIHDLAAEFPEIRSFERVDVNVTPLNEGMEYWAVASVTDNDTQQVLLITADSSR